MQKSDRLLTIFRKYREKNLQVPIIVEGKNDVHSLRRLDFTGEIINLNSGLSLLGKVEQISNAYNEVIVLTDFDYKGTILKKRITGYLLSLGTSPDIYLWNYVNRYLPARTVEELPWAYEKISGVPVR